MSGKVDYLIDKAQTAPREVVSFWEFMGSPVADNSTKIYIKDTLYKITETNSPLCGSFVYCVNPYTVGENNREEIDWNTVSSENIGNFIEVYQGVTSSCFKVVLQNADSFLPSEMSKPFENDEHSFSEINIDDDDLGAMLIEVGVPFLTIDELEYTKDTLLRLCIKPALKTFYNFFPIVREENVGTIGAGGTFEKEFPEDAYHAVAYYVLNGSTAGGGYTSPFSFYREQAVYGGGFGETGLFGRGLRYNKPVPGWVGIQSIDASLQGLQASQGYANLFRREKVKVVKRDGKKYATGFSTLGGSICIKWFCLSYDFNDVDIMHYNDVVKLCTAKILRALGQLRALVKSDIPGSIDYSMYTNRADKIEEEVMSKWNQSATNLSYGIMRGGL